MFPLQSITVNLKCDRGQEIVRKVSVLCTFIRVIEQTSIHQVPFTYVLYTMSTQAWVNKRWSGAFMQWLQLTQKYRLNLLVCMLSILSSSWHKSRIYWWRTICQANWMSWMWDMSSWSNWIHLWYTVPLLALGRLDLTQGELDTMLLHLLLLGWCILLGQGYDYDVLRGPNLC